MSSGAGRSSGSCRRSPCRRRAGWVLLALVSVTVAVKVTEVPEVEVFPGDDEARLVVVESVYWAPPEYTKW